MNPLINFAISMVAVTLSALALEIALQAYVTHIAKQGRLFLADPHTGWRTIPNLRLVRLNAAGAQWIIETNEVGHRIMDPVSTHKRTLLILGDSFAFGEGVDVRDRFDAIIRRLLPETRIINTGTMGFGTDQQYVASLTYLPSLQANDAILVIFYQNDFYDVLRRRFALRARPYFEKKDTGYILHPPRITALDWVRDYSYIASLIGRAVERPESANWDMNEATGIIREILQRIRRDAPADVKLILAHHGRGSGLEIRGTISGARFCDLADLCTDLDEAIAHDAERFLPDAHWSAKGHAIVGHLLAQRLMH